MGIWPNSTGMVPGWTLTKIVQMVLIGCICRSWGQKNRFSKGNFQKSSCLTVQGPQLSNLMYNIILRSSTKIRWTTLVFLCKWLHCDLWPFPQLSDPEPFCPIVFVITSVRKEAKTTAHQCTLHKYKHNKLISVIIKRLVYFLLLSLVLITQYNYNWKQTRLFVSFVWVPKLKSFLAGGEMKNSRHSIK